MGLGFYLRKIQPPLKLCKDEMRSEEILAVCKYAQGPGMHTPEVKVAQISRASYG